MEKSTLSVLPKLYPHQKPIIDHLQCTLERKDVSVCFPNKIFMIEAANYPTRLTVFMFYTTPSRYYVPYSTHALLKTVSFIL